MRSRTATASRSASASSTRGALVPVPEEPMLPAFLLLAFVALTLAPPAFAQPEAPPAKPAPTIVFMTDFGTANDAAAICRAVIAGIAPEARIMDITHQVTPFAIEEAARNLESVTPYYLAGTVFLVVVDP